MAKSPQKKPHKSAEKASPAKLAAEIARVDRELIRLANERARLTSESDPEGLGHAKPSELDWQDKLSRANEGPLTDRCLQAMFLELFSGIDASQQRIRVAYLGPEYT